MASPSSGDVGAAGDLLETGLLLAASKEEAPAAVETKTTTTTGCPAEHETTPTRSPVRLAAAQLREVFLGTKLFPLFAAVPLAVAADHFRFGRLFGVRTGLPLPSIWETAMLLVVYSLVEDYLSYWHHRFLHTKWGYENIHHVHHEKTAPSGFAAAYASGTELSLYIITIFAGPALVPCHITMHWLWFAIRVMEAFDAHCGYDFPFSIGALIPFGGGAEFHDYHHYAGGKTQSNFSSVFTYCDYIYGTNKGYLHHKRSRAKLKANV